ncbi:cyclic-phosphate processing receiver domain-containing protein [Alienimonas californiensis]|uniref:cyclic-phosphate processing receiver domain-containing protein n=1 Tax=Alienimonas californiensis TaxID=2527989 RepID=UPI0011A9A734|nr:cyclic-phosphate processing receiver domain-containing protein [Alienimonas californiensis]
MSAPLEIVILEDDAPRRAAMRAALADRLPQYRPRFFTTAAEAARYLHDHLDRVLLIVLDHDLDPIPVHPRRSLDAGTGRDVADFLAAREPTCPVVIHTTNRPAAVGMEAELTDAGWTVSIVIPYGDLEWIGAEWLRAVRDAVVHAAVPTAVAA